MDAEALDGTPLGPLARVDARGVFEGRIAGPRQPVRYTARAGDAQWQVADAYSFGPVLGPKL